MNPLNQIILEGNVTVQPAVRQTKTGRHVCTLPLAVNRRFKNAEGQPTDEVSYFDVETFGTLADNCAKWCPKGRGVRVVGRLKQDRWKDEDGKNRSRITVIAEHVEFKPFFKKSGGDSAGEEIPGQQDASGASESKRKKLAMLAEAAAAAQSEQEAGEEVVF
ncbi:MAG: single-stranded DNA-binding protein [Treponema sp.]|nr:single-stranded DNA-binding protein [Treponema sp.]